MTTRIKLNHILFIGFTLISAVPVLFLAVWVQSSALNKEVAAVSEKHLLIARNLTGALSRYVIDVEAGFRMISRNMTNGRQVAGMSNLLETLHIRNIRIIDTKGHVQQIVHGSPSMSSKKVAPEVIKGLNTDLKRAKKDRGKVFFSGVMPDSKGQPAIYLVQALPKNRFAIGTLNMDYLIKMQKSIAFGKQGHSAIVDQYGRVLAHPKPSWRLEMKDISKISAVKNMVAGKTGVAQFYSPAKKADMIAGYTIVPEVGWGAMVPQPFEELEERAKDVQIIALTITLLGIMTAGFISWWLSRYLSRPIQAVVDSSKEVASGKLMSQVPALLRFIPYELRELTNSFNHMVRENATLHDKEKEWAQTLEKRVEERTEKLQQTQEQLIQSEKMAAIGMLSAGVAHEINNPLAGIMGMAEAIADEDDPKIYKEYLKDITNYTERAQEIVQDLSSYARETKSATQSTLNLNEVIESSLKMTGKAADFGDIKVEKYLEPLPDVLANYGEAQQIFTNIIMNAVQAMEGHGELHIYSKRVNNDIEIKISDTGPGIPKDSIKQIFDPFYTTKEPGRGTGLGLSIVYRLIKNLKGDLKVESTEGKGCQFILLFPIVSQEGTKNV